MATVDGLITGRALGAAGQPVFASVAEDRLHRKQELAAAFRVFGRFGFSEGVAGHITARDPEYPDRFWVNPFGMSFSQAQLAMAAGPPKHIDAGTALQVREQIGHHLAGWFQFRPLWDQIIASDPDLFG